MVGFPLTSTKAREYAHDREVGIPVTTAETKSPAVVHFWTEEQVCFWTGTKLYRQQALQVPW